VLRLTPFAVLRPTLFVGGDEVRRLPKRVKFFFFFYFVTVFWWISCRLQPSGRYAPLRALLFAFSSQLRAKYHIQESNLPANKDVFTTRHSASDSSNNPQTRSNPHSLPPQPHQDPFGRRLHLPHSNSNTVQLG
jgi:hypothetical protein